MNRQNEQTNENRHSVPSAIWNFVKVGFLVHVVSAALGTLDGLAPNRPGESGFVALLKDRRLAVVSVLAGLVAAAYDFFHADRAKRETVAQEGAAVPPNSVALMPQGTPRMSFQTRLAEETAQKTSQELAP